MKAIALYLSTYTMLYVRLALGITFLAAVTDRYGSGLSAAQAALIPAEESADGIGGAPSALKA